MLQTPRNHPCPCGSGKTHERCCRLAQLPERLKLEWVYWAHPTLPFAGLSVALESTSFDVSTLLLDFPWGSRRWAAELPPALIPSPTSRARIADLVWLKYEGLPVLGFTEFLRHPYAELLAKDDTDFPSLRKISPSFKEATWLTRETFSPYGFFFAESDPGILLAEKAMFSWFERIHSEGEAKIYLGNGLVSRDPLRQVGDAYPFRGFRWESAPSLKFETQPSTYSELESVQLALPDTSHSAWRSQPWKRTTVFEWDSESQELIVSPRLYAVQSLAKIRSNIRTHGHEAVVEAFRTIRNEWREEQWSDADFPVEVAASVRPQIWLSRSGKFQLALICAERGLRIWNLPTPWSKLIQVLQSGVHVLSRKPHTEIATQSAGAKRKLDLKVLKHGGVSRSILAHQIALTLDGKTFEGQEVVRHQDALAHLWRRLAQLLCPGSDEPLDQLCGKRVISLCKVAMAEAERLIEVPATAIIDEGKILQLEGAGQAMGRLFLALLRSWAIAGGPSFLSARPSIRKESVTSGPEHPMSWGVQRTEDLQAPPPEAATAYDYLGGDDSEGRVLLTELLSLGQHGFEVFWEGKPVEMMAEGDFRTEFAIRDTSGDARSGAQSATDDGRPLDWFELHPAFFLKGVPISGADLTRLASEGLIEHGGVLYRVPPRALPQLKRLEAFWARLQANQGSKGDAKKRASPFLLLPRAETLELLCLMKLGVSVNGSERFDRVREAFDRLANPRSEDLKLGGFKGELKHYQTEGVQWLLDLHDLGLGGILADDMGLGKTVQILAFLSALRARSPKKNFTRALVVVPTTLTENWKAEAERFAPDLSLEMTTYGMLTEHGERFLEREFDLVIFDEAQALKTLSAQRTRVARGLKAKLKIAMTGTPMENHWGEFYSIMDLVCPGSLGSWERFQKGYLKDIGPSSVEIRNLRERIKPLMLRRTKAEVLLDLPEKIESRVLLAFESQQKKIYRDTALSWSGKVRSSIEELGESGSQLHMLTALMRLRQICSDPTAAPGVRYQKIPPKLDWILERVRQISESGESALIFGQFIATLEHTKKLLEAEGVKVDMITGSVPAKQRAKILEAFKKGEGSRFLLMTLKTGGVGLNLTKASHVIHLDPWWNPAAENQATDRAHRLGQKEVVQVHRLFIQHSVEEKIELLQRRKQGSFDALFGVNPDQEDSAVDAEKAGRARLSQSDFETLISLAAGEGGG